MLLGPPFLVACGTPTGADKDSGSPAVDGPVDGPGDLPEDDTGTPPVAGEVRLFINELMPANEGALEVDGETPDWLELYNPGDADVPLAGFSLTDDLDDPQKTLLDDTLAVPAQGFLLLYADGGTGGQHLGFKLSGDGEAVGLFFPDGSQADAVRFGAVPDNLALARFPDGAADWHTTASPTPGAENEID